MKGSMLKKSFLTTQLPTARSAGETRQLTSGEIPPIVATKVRKAVLLAGGERVSLMPITRYYPAMMFPVLNRTIIEYSIDYLKRKGVDNVIITLSEKADTAYLEDLKLREKDITIHIHMETKPRGPAGILTDVADLLDGQPFLVVNSSLYLGEIDLDGMIGFHAARKAVITSGIRRIARRRPPIESVRVSHEGRIDDIHIIHHSSDKRSPWVSSGIYVFSPKVLEFIDSKGYFDIKEQLLPALKAAGQPVYAYEIKGYHKSINSLNDYIGIHRDLLDMPDTSTIANKKEIGEKIWVGDGVDISPDAYMMGPVIIGDRCTIAGGAQIVGPAVIGDDCKISSGSIVRESILWNGVILQKRARVDYCIAGENLVVLEDERLKNAVLTENLSTGDINIIPRDYYRPTVIPNGNQTHFVTSARYGLFNMIKRAMDIFVSLIGLFFSLPLFFLIAVAIKADSSGPVFFKQKRCGKNGKEFTMIKFRTMVQDAPGLQNKLSANKDVDGPVFKMKSDPRITRIGRILRKTSLDELPQLFNVLKGEMSLVGPRPLVMSEMKCSPNWREVRLKVKPGITGLWQIQGRSEAPFHDWIRYDIYYVKHQSIFLDLKILIKTIKVVVKLVGAV